MFTLVTGVPGAGKTLFVLTKYIIPEFEKNTGRKIVTNIPLMLDAISNVYGSGAVDSLTLFDGSYSDILAYQDGADVFLKNVLFIIDECQEHFTKEHIEGTETMEYFSRHRKYACDFVIITQNPLLISRKVRALVEYCHYLSKTRSIGGNGFIVKTYAGQSTRAKPITQTELQYKPEYYGFYRSYSEEGLKEISTIKAKLSTKIAVLIYKNLVPIVIGILLFVAVVFYRKLTSPSHSSNSSPSVTSVSSASSSPDVAVRAKNFPGVTGYDFQPLSMSTQVLPGGVRRVVSCRMRRLVPHEHLKELRDSSASGAASLPSFFVVPCDFGGSSVSFDKTGRVVVVLPDGRVVD